MNFLTDLQVLLQSISRFVFCEFLILSLCSHTVYYYLYQTYQLIFVHEEKNLIYTKHL